jgi:hypothetical protein
MDVLEEMMMSGRDDHLPRRSANEKEVCYIAFFKGNFCVVVTLYFVNLFSK